MQGVVGVVIVGGLEAEGVQVFYGLVVEVAGCQMVEVFVFRAFYG